MEFNIGDFNPNQETMDLMEKRVSEYLKKNKTHTSLPYLRAFLAGMEFVSDRVIVHITTGNATKDTKKNAALLVGSAAALIKVIKKKENDVAKKVDTITGEQNPPL